MTDPSTVLSKGTFTRKAWQFFLEHAGYATPPGRVACAAELARAENYVRNHTGWHYEWMPDDDDYVNSLGDHEEWCDKARKGEPHEHEMESCGLVTPAGGVLAALCGIIDPDRDYRRVVEAELAVEALTNPPAPEPIQVYLPWEGDEPRFDAYTDGQTWNGWQCPRFERAEADKVLAFLTAWNPQPQGPGFYDPNRDAYLTPDENSPGEWDVWQGKDWEGRHVYAIGAFSWTWDYDI